MPSSSSSFNNVFDMLMERDISNKSMIKGPTLAEEMKTKNPAVKKIQMVKSGVKKTSKTVPPPITAPSLFKGYRIPKKKVSAPSSGAQKSSKPATTAPATPTTLKSIVVKKTSRINEKMLHKMIVKNN